MRLRSVRLPPHLHLTSTTSTSPLPPPPPPHLLHLHFPLHPQPRLQCSSDIPPPYPRKCIVELDDQQTKTTRATATAAELHCLRFILPGHLPLLGPAHRRQKELFSRDKDQPVLQIHKELVAKRIDEMGPISPVLLHFLYLHISLFTYMVFLYCLSFILLSESEN